jgi:parallel beta-helix repeat protein
MLTLAVNIQPAEAIGVIRIEPDGSINPPTAPIQRVGDIYTFTDNIYGYLIEVWKPDVIIDGNEYTLQGDGTSFGFNVFQVNNVTIKKTNISNFEGGVRLEKSHYDNIADNNITNVGAYRGIQICLSNNTTVTGNSITNASSSGCWMYLSNNTLVTGNTISNVTGTGIRVDESLGNTIEGNIISDNGLEGISLDESPANITNNVIESNKHGISLDKSSNSFIEDNKILKNQGHGIFVDENSDRESIIGNDIENNGYGIQLNASYYNTVTYNNVANNTYGIYLFNGCHYNTVSYNSVANNTRGISLLWSTENTLTDNNITRNTMYGIELHGYSSSNNIYHNSFINNTNQIHIGERSNTWDTGYPSGGNYWSDYAGNDDYKGPGQDIPGFDGIGDDAYEIDDSNIDHYPLMLSYPSHDVGIIANKSQKQRTIVGNNLSITVIMLNYGIHPENLTIELYANATITCRVMNITLEPRSSDAKTLIWNTSGLAKGNYTIWAYVIPVDGETDTSDNTFLGVSINVTIAGDVSGNGKVDLEDVLAVAIAFGALRGANGLYWHQPICPTCPHSQNLDIDDKGEIDLADYLYVVINYGKEDP